MGVIHHGSEFLRIYGAYQKVTCACYGWGFRFPHCRLFTAVSAMLIGRHFVRHVTRALLLSP